jgi:hypothetical protein
MSCIAEPTFEDVRMELRSADAHGGSTVKLSATLLVVALLVVGAGSVRAEIYNCEILGDWNLEKSGLIEPNKVPELTTGKPMRVGRRFTVDSATGAVTGDMNAVSSVGQWRVFSKGDKNWSLEVIRFSQNAANPEPRPFDVISIMTWQNTPQKPFTMLDIGQGGVRTGLCSVQQPAAPQAGPPKPGAPKEGGGPTFRPSGR